MTALLFGSIDADKQFDATVIVGGKNQLSRLKRLSLWIFVQRRLLQLPTAAMPWHAMLPLQREIKSLSLNLLSAKKNCNNNTNINIDLLLLL